mgnify:CR=1 FL=1
MYDVLLHSTHDIPKEFLEEISSLYFEAVNEYGIDYQKLKSSRNIKKALDL